MAADFGDLRAAEARILREREVSAPVIRSPLAARRAPRAARCARASPPPPLSLSARLLRPPAQECDRLVAQISALKAESELAEERLVVLGQVVAGVTVEDLQVGMAMELVADVLDADDEHTFVVWKWRPAATTTGDDEAGAN